MDILDFFRGVRPWEQLLRYIDNLPPHSRYVAAVLDDPEYAKRIAEQGEPASKAMGMQGFDPIRAMLTAILDAINVNTSTVIAAAGAEPPKFVPAPTPETELDRARERFRHQQREDLTALALGHRNE